MKPDVRLAWFDIPAVNNTLDTPAADAPVVRLAHKAAQGDGVLTGSGYGGVSMMDKKLTEREAPALLVSYYYLEPFIKNRSNYQYRDWVMDSGAFSAHNSGKHIDLQKYIDKCLELTQSDPTLTEVFSLDVIPKDHKPTTVQAAAEQSLKNCEEMWRQGVQAIPTFHRGEDESFLYAMAKDYPKIAIGGVALLRGDQKFLFCEQVFARVWPKKIHGLGMASEELIYGLPFHSVDATNWEMAPCAFGNWQKFGQMSVRGSNQDLRSQVKYYLELEAKARVRWEKQMNELAALPGVKPSCWVAPVVRLVANGNAGCEDAKMQAFNSASTSVAPSVRLAVDAGAAGGQHAAIAFQKETKPKRVASVTSKSKQEAKPEPTEIDSKWADFWKNRS